MRRIDKKKQRERKTHARRMREERESKKKKGISPLAMQNARRRGKKNDEKGINELFRVLAPSFINSRRSAAARVMKNSQRSIDDTTKPPRSWEMIEFSSRQIFIDKKRRRKIRKKMRKREDIQATNCSSRLEF